MINKIVNKSATIVMKPRSIDRVKFMVIGDWVYRITDGYLRFDVMSCVWKFRNK